MLYTITAINGNAVTLDKQPPSTAFWNHNWLVVDAVPSTLHNTIIISEQMQERFALKVGSEIYLDDNPKVFCKPVHIIYKTHHIGLKTFFFREYEVLYYESILNTKFNHYVLLRNNSYIEDRYWIKWFKKFPTHFSILYAHISRLWRKSINRILKHKHNIRNWYIEKYVHPRVIGMLSVVAKDMDNNN